MTLFFYLFIAILGLFVGSFLNCAIYRIEKGKSFLRGRSYCPHCKHTLRAKDLVPLLSYLFLRGKCRYCGAKISFQYPLVELATSVVFLLVFHFQLFSIAKGALVFNLQNIVSSLFLFAVFSILILIFVYDLKHFLIPDSATYSAVVLVLLYRLFQVLVLKFPFQTLLNSFYAALLATGFFLLIILFSRGKWMGMGDVKLGFLMGFLLGPLNMAVALFSAFFLGAIIGVGLIVAGKKGMKSEIPFGPFLVLGTAIAMFWGQEIVNWYLTLFI